MSASTDRRAAPLTPAMAELLRRIERSRREPLHHMTPAEARRAYVAGAEVLDLPRAPLARVETLRLPLAPGVARDARLYVDQARSSPSSGQSAPPVLLYLHGGGFTIGGLESHDSLCRQIARRSGAAVLA
ncbi:MAG: alpha/beta hydrolase fold domain-containing protein, partial [Leptothrix sp. (in: b-proteobacteria)]